MRLLVGFVIEDEGFLHPAQVWFWGELRKTNSSVFLVHFGPPNLKLTAGWSHPRSLLAQGIDSRRNKLMDHLNQLARRIVNVPIR